MARVRVQQEDFDTGAELAALRSQDLRVGAVCSFVGTVRQKHPDGSPEAAPCGWRSTR